MSETMKAMVYLGPGKKKYWKDQNQLRKTVRQRW